MSRADVAYTAERIGQWWRWKSGATVSLPTYTSHDAALEAGRDHGYRAGFRKPIMRRDGSLTMECAR